MAENVSFSVPVVIYNIPKDFDTFSLREFFHEFVEADGFHLFHFKNRPESSMREFVQKYFPSTTLQSTSKIISQNFTNSDVKTDFDFNSYINKCLPDHNEKVENTNEAIPDTKSGFAYVRQTLLEDLLANYHKCPWQLGEENCDGLACCYITRLHLGNEDDLKNCEEMHPPTGLCNGNVGTKNSHLVRLIRTGILGKSFMLKIQQRAPLLWNWALPPAIPCRHSACGMKQCEILFILDIPPSFIKRDLKNFFLQPLRAGDMCDIIYLQRPSSNLKQFMKENMPHFSLEGSLDKDDNDTLNCVENSATSLLDLYPFSRRISDETKSCLVRVASDSCQDFIQNHHGKPWQSGEGTCSVVRVSREHTASLVFLSEFWKFAGVKDIVSTSEEPEEFFMKLFLAGLPPVALRDRLRNAVPHLWKKIEGSAMKMRSNISRKPLKNTPRSTSVANKPYKKTVAIPPPLSLVNESIRKQNVPAESSQLLSFNEKGMKNQDNCETTTLNNDCSVTNSSENNERISSNGMKNQVNFLTTTLNNDDSVTNSSENNESKSPGFANTATNQTRTERQARKPRGKKKANKRKKNETWYEGNEGSEDESDVEEWERSEAFRDTIDEKRSAKEPRYEQEIELVWEKGGSGLNWHTDAAYWREQEGGFDERTTDEWDVDMQAYYGGVAGDYDAVCRQDMDRMDRLRAGEDESCFAPPSGRALKANKQRRTTSSTTQLRTTTSPFIAPCTESPDAARRRMLVNLRTDDVPVPGTRTARRKANRASRTPASAGLGEFEQHTRGVGRRVLEAQGWRDGQGLGKRGEGRPNIVATVHRLPTDKKGLGFLDPGPCWKATGAPVAYKSPERCSSDLENITINTYKNIPLVALNSYYLEQKKIFETDCLAVLGEGCSGTDENTLDSIHTLHETRRKKLKKMMSELEAVEVSEKKGDPRECFVKAGDVQVSSNSDDGENIKNDSPCIINEGENKEESLQRARLMEKHLEYLNEYGVCEAQVEDESCNDVTH